jgi:hypothetical protein
MRLLLCVLLALVVCAETSLGGRFSKKVVKSDYPRKIRIQRP